VITITFFITILLFSIYFLFDYFRSSEASTI